MDIQRKKGLLEICVLALLRRGPLYGYKIIDEVSGVIEVSESTLYPILKRLEASGCLTTYTQEHGGRLRKYYSVTQAGQDKITAFLSESEELKRIYAFIEGETV